MSLPFLLLCHDGDAAITANCLNKEGREGSADVLFYLGLESALDKISVK